jgi:CTP:molybdopterin cytidylyltransferase MocA
MTARNAAGVLLAAGAGTRLGEPKALANVAGEPLVTRGVRTLMNGGCRPVVVVLGSAAGDVRAGADLTGAEVVVNDQWEDGMSSSFRAAIDALRGRAHAAVVALVDQPLVTAAVVRRLVEAWTAGAVVAVATYDGAPRNPVLFDERCWDDVTAGLTGDEGARAWLRAHPDAVTHVECGALGSFADVDTPDDLAAITAALEERQCS